MFPKNHVLRSVEYYQLLNKEHPSKNAAEKQRKDAVPTSANLRSSSKLRSSSCLKRVFCCSYMREACSARCLSFSSFISTVVIRWATEINSLSSRSCDLAAPGKIQQENYTDTEKLMHDDHNIFYAHCTGCQWGIASPIKHRSSPTRS